MENISEPVPIDQQQVLNFRGKIDYGYMYHTLMNNLIYLHRVNQDEQAQELFYNSISDYGSLWDSVFIENCSEIEKDYTNPTTRYRLHKVEFSRLLQRVGISPKPDIRLDIIPPWDVPKNLENLKEGNGEIP